MSEHVKNLAMYRSVRYEYTTIQEVTSNYEDDSNYVRISDCTEVNFIERDQANVQEDMIQGTLSEMESVEEDYTRTRAKLEEKLNELRALPAPERMVAA